jgi:uncharacterized protein with ParB-like and HNH nuclease domain
MKPDKLTVHDLFEQKRRYIVPLFQRPYVWNKEEQWQPLWQDIEDKADQIQADDGQVDNLGAHFLGAVVISEVRTFGKQVRTHEIIDGQQRLTTLQILLIAFRNFLRTVNYQDIDSDVLDDITRLTINSGSVSEDIEKYKVWPTATDRPAFEFVSNGHNGHEDKTKKISRLIEAYEFFYHMIDEYIQYGETDDDIQSERTNYDSEAASRRIDALIQALRRYLEIVVIELETGDDPQIIFETLNARGVPLLPSDLIRNFIFLQASRNGEDVANLYSRYWLRYDDSDTGQGDFWKAEEKQGRLLRPRIDLFFFHYLTLKTQREIKITHLFQEFRRWWEQVYAEFQTVEAVLLELQEYSQLYNKLMTLDTETRLGVFMARLKVMEINTIYPLILYLYGGHDGLSDINQIIIYLESYLVRRMVCSLSTKNYNKLFPQIIRELRRAEKVDAVILWNILSSFEGDAGRWPKNEEFEQRWKTLAIYKRIAQSRTRMILEALDIQQVSNKQEQIYIKDKLSIEHIYPQTPDASVWPPLPNSDIVHTIGNLTLLTTPLNSSVSNGAFVLKRVEIAHQSRLRLNVYFQDLVGKDTWTADDIAERGSQLFSLAASIWPTPKVT